MKFLVCIIDGQKAYYPINNGQEQAINNVFKAKNKPTSFTLKGKQIETSTILGFTEDAPRPVLGKGYESFLAAKERFKAKV